MYQFTWEFIDQSKKYHRIVSTPLEFFADISKPTGTAPGYDITKSVTLIHDPRNKPGVFTPEDGGIVVGSKRPVRYLNCELEVMKASAINQIKVSSVPLVDEKIHSHPGIPSGTFQFGPGSTYRKPARQTLGSWTRVSSTFTLPLVPRSR